MSDLLCHIHEKVTEGEQSNRSKSMYKSTMDLKTGTLNFIFLTLQQNITSFQGLYKREISNTQQRFSDAKNEARCSLVS